MYTILRNALLFPNYLGFTSTEKSEYIYFLFDYFVSVFKPLSKVSTSTYKCFRLPFDLLSNCSFSPNEVFNPLTSFRSINSRVPDRISTCILYSFPIFHKQRYFSVGVENQFRHTNL